MIAAQDEVGGLYVRPPVEGEKRKRNWLPTESSAGMYENDEPWNFVKPAPKIMLSNPHWKNVMRSDRFALSFPLV